MIRCVLVLLLAHVLLLSATPESLFFPHLSPPSASDSPILFGLGTDNDGGCLLQVNQSTGEATCWLNQCPVGANCLAADAMDPAYAQAVPGTTQIFEWGYGPCCNTDYSAYLVVDVESKEINGIYQITTAEISAAAPAGKNKYWAVIQELNSVTSRDFEIVQLGLDKSNSYEILAKFPDSPIIPGAYTTPGMFVDNVRNRVIVMGQLEDGETGGMIINSTDWSLINTVPYGKDFLPMIVSYDDTTDTMVALDFQDFGNTVKYIAWPPDTQPDFPKKASSVKIKIVIFLAAQSNQAQQKCTVW
eukprot:CAMPEP_0201508658 /NCGR_PEP_ID=MMETSP0161_2-20130828/1955_1 /ASSEMBLY_ACC=CAM_ASM_000251 /TAXON_ID=180227 /ORGANISM="Neoparamoeba aestuarina, Strain SoJaBio B1-5/56/2" /LENGTH=301 /DNA_ID=CAMNT_0047903389 /DNA_START=41 /DNA_END=944 /DNA_ORIENTATION=-